MVNKISMKLYFILSILTILIFNSVEASKKSFKKGKTTSKIEKKKDQYYLVVVDNGIKEGHVKREEKEQFLDALVSEINNLIIGNKDTYEDLSKFEVLEKSSTSSPFSKRNVEENENEHKFAYVISSLEDESLIFSYLSEDLVSEVENLPNIKALIPDFQVKTNSNEKLKSIKSSTSWDSVCVKGNTYNYLSLLSQDKFNEKIQRNPPEASYDKNYYYPGSAGEGMNVFILDSGFNFRHSEFSDRSNGRTIQCLITFDQNQYKYEFNDHCMNDHSDPHGSKVAAIIGGKTNGVASKANIYGIGVRRGNNQSISSYIKGLEYINQVYLTQQSQKYAHKTIINMSSSFDLTQIDTRGMDDLIKYYGDLLHEMSMKGSVIVVSADNQSKVSDNIVYPCSFDDVICVGSIDNIGINDECEALDRIIKDKYNSNKYPNHDQWQEQYNRIKSRYDDKFSYYIDKKTMWTKNYNLAFFSNYGKVVDIYAPGLIKVNYQDETGQNRTENDLGTSFSAPIVAGVAATIMSEFRNDEFYTPKMLSHLKHIGLNNIISGIPSEYPNVFINNGNHNSFVQSTEYNTCGANNQVCSNSNELICYYHGCCLKK